MSGFPVRMAVALVAALIASILAAASLILAGAVFYEALLGIATPAVAGIVTSFVGLAVAAGVMLIGRAVMTGGRDTATRSAKQAAMDGLSSQDKMIAELGGLVGAELAALIRSHPHETAAGSLAAGFALGASPRLRGFLRNLL